MKPEEIELTYQTEDEPIRADQYIAREVRQLTRSAVQRLFDAGLVTVNGLPAKPSLKLKGGERIAVAVPAPAPAEAVAEQIPLEILYEDSDIIVINKPAGMSVHPGAGRNSGTLVNALLGHCRDLSGVGGELRPGIVHRIDKDTTGILVAAKNDAAHQALARQFKEHTVKRIYLALVYGSPREERGRIASSIGRHPGDRKRMSSTARHGRHAVTHWRAICRYNGISLLSMRLETGRTHQIRVHLSEAGHPLVGDATYGGSGRIAGVKDTCLRRMIKDLGRQALHAATLGFIHPVTGAYLEFSAEIPEDMSSIMRHLEEESRPQTGAPKTATTPEQFPG